MSKKNILDGIEKARVKIRRLREKVEDIRPQIPEIIGSIIAGDIIGGGAVFFYPPYIKKVFKEIRNGDADGLPGFYFYTSGVLTYGWVTGYLSHRLFEHPENLVNYLPFATNIFSSVIRHRIKVKKEKKEISSLVAKLESREEGLGSFF